MKQTLLWKLQTISIQHGCVREVKDTHTLYVLTCIQICIVFKFVSCVLLLVLSCVVCNSCWLAVCIVVVVYVLLSYVYLLYFFFFLFF